MPKGNGAHKAQKKATSAAKINKAGNRFKSNAPKPTVSKVPFVVGRTGGMPMAPPLVFEYTEEIGKLTMFESFTNTPLLLTMTNPELFPFGHKLAQLFHTREWISCKLRYEPSAPADTGGTIGVVNNPDPDQPPATSMDKVLQAQGSQQTNPWEAKTIDLLLPSTKNIPKKYNETLEGMVGLGFSSLLSDTLHTVADGVVNIAVEGLLSILPEQKLVAKALKNLAEKKEFSVSKKDTDPAESMTTGRLWVDYKVKLTDPVNDDVDVGVFQAFWPVTFEDAKTDTKWPSEDPIVTQVNELGIETEWAVSVDGQTATVTVNCFESGYYDVTVDYVNEYELLSMAEFGPSVALPVETSELVAQNANYVSETGEVGSYVTGGDLGYAPFSGLVRFDVGDDPDETKNNVLLKFAVTNNATTLAEPAAGTIRIKVTYAGETLELSKMALFNKQKKLPFPKNRALFHALKERRNKRVADFAQQTKAAFEKEMKKSKVQLASQLAVKAKPIDAKGEKPKLSLETGPINLDPKAEEAKKIVVPAQVPPLDLPKLVKQVADPIAAPVCKENKVCVVAYEWEKEAEWRRGKNHYYESKTQVCHCHTWNEKEDGTTVMTCVQWTDAKPWQARKVGKIACLPCAACEDDPLCDEWHRFRDTCRRFEEDLFSQRSS